MDPHALSSLRATRSTPQRCIALTEDDRELRRFLALVLRQRRFRVIELANGSELLDYLASAVIVDRPGPLPMPDLILSDVRMPRFDGFTVLAGLDAGGWRIPVILMTAFGSAELHAAAKARGAVAVLDKPFDVEDLLRAIDESVAR